MKFGLFIALGFLFCGSESLGAKTIPLQIFNQVDAFLVQKKYPQALNKISAFPKNTLYEDHRLATESRVYFEQASDFLLKKQKSLARTTAERSMKNWFEIQKNHPDSLYNREAVLQVVRAEFLIAQALSANKNTSAQARVTFERAFQRLQNLGTAAAWRSLEPKHLDDYKIACKNIKITPCAPWVGRLTAQFSRTSSRIMHLSPEFDQIINESLAFPSISKQLQTYKAPDQDMDAFDDAFQQYVSEDFDKAEDDLQTFLVAFPKSTQRFRARYWLGKTLLKLKKNKDATDTFESLFRDVPLHYYGLLAAWELGKKPEDALLNDALMSESESPALWPSEQTHLKKTLEFLAADSYTRATRELQEIKSRDTFSNSFIDYLIGLNSRLHNYISAISLHNELFYRGVAAARGTSYLDILFPLEFWDLIRFYSGSQQVDPVLVLSLIKQESAFDRDAVSSSGALGLMQLMPQTALQVDPHAESEDLILHEDANINLGTHYLAQLLTQFDQNIIYALAAYNAGPHRLKEWLKDIPPGSPEEFIEHIPFRETREYVASIIRNYYWYSGWFQKKTGGTPTGGIGKFWTPKK